MKNKYTRLERMIFILGLLAIIYIFSPSVRDVVTGFFDGWEGIPPRY